jgi:ribosomal protein S18 acetylase RimI-like enzyme
MERLIRHDLSESDMRPGSTLRPIARVELERDGETVAGVTLGRAEVFERQPIEYTLARWSFPEADVVAGAAVLTAGADTAPAGVPIYLDVNAAVYEDADDRCAVAGKCGFELHIEKLRLAWTDDGQSLNGPTGLTFRTLAEVGRDRLASAMAGAATSTLDRADSLSLAHQDPRHWADSFIAHDARSVDEASWLLAESAGGEPIGVVGISADGNDATLCYLCVAPAYRGRRLGEQLVYAGYRAARQRGLVTVYAYVDAANRPMLSALERSGARVDAWHKWLFVRSPRGILNREVDR